jgi:hypothetical protein
MRLLVEWLLAFLARVVKFRGFVRVAYCVWGMEPNPVGVAGPYYWMAGGFGSEALTNALSIRSLSAWRGPITHQEVCDGEIGKIVFV